MLFHSRHKHTAWLVCWVVFAALPMLGATRTVHVFVALADNQHQGIIPVPARLGNGDDPERNLYWGSAYGVRTFFVRSADWKLITQQSNPKPAVLERCIFRHRSQDVYLVADAYRGSEIKQALMDFFDAAGAMTPEKIVMDAKGTALAAGGAADLVAYVGHDGLMDFELPRFPKNQNKGTRQAIILACASKQYFSAPLRASGAHPLLWTTNLMAPEAYTLKGALDGWTAGESDQQVRERAAAAYHQYQKCGLAAARRLFVTGW